MIGENRQLVTNELVEFEILPVKLQDCRKITDHLRGIYRIYPNLIKKNRRLSTYNRLDLQTLGSQPVLPKNLPITGLHTLIPVSVWGFITWRQCELSHVFFSIENLNFREKSDIKVNPLFQIRKK